MKKILKISLVSMMVAMPMIAGAAPVAGDPGATTTGAPTATNTPKYALKGTGAGDENTATAGYVKGAYNAVIKGINNTQDEINTLNTDITTYRNAIGHLTDGKATQDGTVATIKNATTTESINDSTVNFTGVTTTSISATASGNINLSVPVMDNWENDAEATNPVQTTTSFSGLAVENLAMSAPTTNTATLTKTGINGTVDVVKYLASMGFDFTQLIDVQGDDFGFNMINGSESKDADKYGLANGEWAVEWNDYGIIRGVGVCSSTEYDVNSEDYTRTTISTDGETKNCWCKMTRFTDKSGATYDLSSSVWFIGGGFPSPEECADCAAICGTAFEGAPVMRSAMFGSVQQ